MITPDPASDDFYRRLGLAPEATHEEVRRAYRALVRQYSPERSPEQFKQVRAAYEVLGNSAARRQYDQRLDPEAAAWFDAGVKAMSEDDYRQGEHQLERVLATRPDMSYVRFLLGVCRLRLDEPQRALPEFERLIQEGSIVPSVFANAGEALRGCGRFDEAAQMLGRAVDLGTEQGEDTVSFVIGLVNTLFDRGRPDDAKGRLREAIDADGKVDFADLRYLIRLLEIALVEGDDAAIDALLGQVRRLTSVPDEVRYCASRLGVIAIQLVQADAFVRSRQVALAASLMQPDDGDYSALAEVAGFFDAGQHDKASQFMAAHRSFAPGGWLYPLHAELESKAHANKLLTGAVPPVSVPPRRPSASGRFLVIALTMISISYLRTLSSRPMGRYPSSPVVSLPAARAILPTAPSAGSSPTPATGQGGYFQGGTVDPFAQTGGSSRALDDSIKAVRASLLDLEQQLSAMKFTPPAASGYGSNVKVYDEVAAERDRLVKLYQALVEQRKRSR